jgi:beta-lactamase regulating signal transducer with metallopeptidase domain
MIDWLIGTLLATSALILLVLLFREPVRRRFGSRAAYGLWLIPAARLFMPTLTHTVERTVPAPAALQPLTDPLVRESLWMARVAPPDPSLIDRLGGWPNMLFAAWVAVAAALFLSRLAAYRRDRLAILASSIDVGRIGSVRIVGSPEVVSPVALGIFDRVIAVPLEFDRLYGARERRLVIEHELAHHRSGDLVANLFAFVLLCLQWFNPLAWLAHAAFRFDQEAACDARVLDKATAADRADYGRAIAKAASGRTLLFASALDRRNTLHRRLQSMLRSSNPGRRVAGRLLVVTAIAVALPLTASHAVRYVDVLAGPAPAPTVPHSALAGALPASMVAAAQALPASAPPIAPATDARSARGARGDSFHVAPGQHFTITGDSRPRASSFDVTTSDGQHFTVAGTPVAALSTYTIASADGRHFILKGAPPQDFEIRGNGGTFVIDGKARTWDELTPVEKARVRDAVARAGASLQNVHIDQARIAQDLAAMPDQLRLAELQRQLARTQANAAENAEVARRAVAAVDWRRIAKSVADARRAVAGVDLRRAAQSAAGAQQSVENAKAELDRIQARIDADPNP